MLVTYTETNELGETKTYTATFQLSTQYLIGISVEQEPYDMEYMVGESLDLTGIKVVADYADGTTADVTSSCTYSPANGYTFVSDSEGEINISYTEDGITKTTSITVLVEPVPVFTGISVTTPPTKTEYHYGETLDYTGIVVEGMWSDGRTEIVTPDCTYSPNDGDTVFANTSGTVVVSYTRDGVTYTDNFYLTILEPEVSVLEYTNYIVDNVNRQIVITSLQEQDMITKGVTIAYIPKEVMRDGVMYEVLIGQYSTNSYY